MIGAARRKITHDRLKPDQTEATAIYDHDLPPKLATQAQTRTRSPSR